jgi:cytochrome P450
MSELRITDSAFRADPAPLHRALHAQEGTRWSPELKAWVVSRHDHVRAAFTDPALSSAVLSPHAGREEHERLIARLSAWMNYNDPPRHTRLRTVIRRAFTPRAVATLRPRIEAMADGLAEAIDREGAVDVVAEFAYPLTSGVIAELLGVPAGSRKDLGRWADAVNDVLGRALSLPDRHRRAGESLDELAALIGELVDERRERPRDDLVSALVDAQRAEDGPETGEIVALCSTLLVAGHATTTNLIGLAALAYAAGPKSFDTALDEGRIGEVAEELLRLEAPAQMLARIATSATEIGGARIAPGDFVYVALGAANRDAGYYGRGAEELCPGREPGRHFAFGHGIHFCIGAPLARLEADIALTRLFGRLRSRSVVVEDTEWHQSIALRGPRRVLLRLGSAG